MPKAIIAEVHAPQRLPYQPCQHMAMPPGPVLDARLAVVAFRQNVGVCKNITSRSIYAAWAGER
ncbi:MAG TPA: hypothetical protein PKZ84_22950, partial [Anaerolineae bacterium]|nr:hypothetical protein [Anaerolineae bacterium]HQI87700.1 hypothetical protein [Anaerolineae bacterium]